MLAGVLKRHKISVWLKGRVGSLGASKYFFPPQLDFSAVLYLWQTPPLTNRSDLKYTIPFQITERQQGRWVTFWTFQKGLLDDFQNILRRKARIRRMSTSQKMKSLWFSLRDNWRPRISSSVSPSANISVMIFKGQCKSLKRIASVETLWWKYWKFKKSNKNKKLNNISWARTFFEKSKNNIFKRKKTCLGVDAEVPRRPDERHLKKDIFWIFHFFLQILRQKSHSSIHNKSGSRW